MIYVLETLFLILLLHICAVSCQNSVESLKLVHVIFRHGNRTPDVGRGYPTDPHVNETYYPYGSGQLTNEGKSSVYLIGKSLRERYDKFLGPLYIPEMLSAVSTDSDRTKMSLEVLLAGIFPPKGTLLEWQTKLNWQPIPYDQLPFETNPLLSLPFYYCPRYISLLNYHLNTTEGIALQNKYKELFEYIGEQTGLSSLSFLDSSHLYATLTAQIDVGLQLPPWTKSVYPKQLIGAVSEFFKFSSSTPELKQLSGGFALRKVVDDTKAKFENTLQPAGRKLFLYSVHDINLVYILSAMNLYHPPQWPPYSSYLLIEAHEINNVAGIKVLYQDYSQEEPRVVNIPGCDEFCPFDDVLKLLNDSLAKSNNSCEIDSSTNVKGLK